MKAKVKQLKTRPTDYDDMGHLNQRMYIVPKDQEKLLSYMYNHYEYAYSGGNEAYFYMY
jgi:hypothetical protein